jgi:hypothetical protein
VLKSVSKIDNESVWHWGCINPVTTSCFHLKAATVVLQQQREVTVICVLAYAVAFCAPPWVMRWIMENAKKRKRILKLRDTYKKQNDKEIVAPVHRNDRV